MKAINFLSLAVASSSQLLDLAPSNTLYDRGADAESLGALPETFPLNLWDDAVNVWQSGQNIIDNYNCVSLPKTADCCKNRCPICRGGTAWKILYSLGIIGDTVLLGKINKQQLSSGDICGMPKSFCDQFTKYVSRPPATVASFLEMLHITLPQYYEAGSCPNGAPPHISPVVSLALLVTAAGMFYN